MEEKNKLKVKRVTFGRKKISISKILSNFTSCIE